MNITDNIITSFIATIVTILVKMWQDRVEEKQQQLTYLQSILSEVNALISLLRVRKDEFELQDRYDVEHYEFVYFPTSYNYFNVYEGMVSKIGIVKNVALRERIICSYTDIKGLFENVKDIENISKMYENLMLTNKGRADKARMVEIHYLYCDRTLKMQVPMVQKVLDTLRFELEHEIKKRSEIWNLYVYDCNE